MGGAAALIQAEPLRGNFADGAALWRPPIKTE